MDPGWQLLERVAQGDEASFERLVVEYQDRVLGLCRRMLGNSGEAEEAAQEVFVKVYGKAGKLQPKGRLYTWLYRVATNHCLNILRRRRIVRFIPLVRDSEEGAEEMDPVDGGADPLRVVEARERWRETERGIADLPDGQRAVLVLAKFEGLSYREIAEVLEITEGAVESRLFRAMQSLRKKAQES
jgi:RNA polymerase sigma-70 factor (ECF subfamily)